MFDLDVEAAPDGAHHPGALVVADQEEARKETILRLKGFNGVGLMENPPTIPSAFTAAGDQA